MKPDRVSRRIPVELRQQVAADGLRSCADAHAGDRRDRSPGRFAATRESSGDASPGDPNQPQPIVEIVAENEPCPEDVTDQRIKSHKIAENDLDPEVITDELRFSLCYYRVNDRLAVINEIPHLQGNTNQADAIALLKSILLALDLDISNCVFKAEKLNWPLIEELSPHNDQIINAKNALLGFIKIRQEIDKFSNLLIFAGQIEDLLLIQEEKIEKRDYRAVDSDFFITLTSSLQSMLALPILKRDVWQQLQPLRQRLSSSEDVLES